MILQTILKQPLMKSMAEKVLTFLLQVLKMRMFTTKQQKNLKLLKPDLPLATLLSMAAKVMILSLAVKAKT